MIIKNALDWISFPGYSDQLLLFVMQLQCSKAVLIQPSNHINLINHTGNTETNIYALYEDFTVSILPVRQIWGKVNDDHQTAFPYSYKMNLSAMFNNIVKN